MPIAVRPVPNGIMPAAMYARYHVPIDRSVTTCAVVRRRERSLLLLRVRAAEIGLEPSPRPSAFVSGVGGVTAVPAGDRQGGD